MKTTQSIRLDAKVIEHIKQIWKGNFNKWVELLYDNYNTSVTHVWYSEFKEALQSFIEVAKKFRPEQPMIHPEKIHQEAVAVRQKDRLQSIADWVKPDATPVMDHPLRTAKDYQDAKLLAWKIRIGIKKNHWKMQDNDWFDCTWQKRISLEWCSHLESLIETMI